MNPVNFTPMHSLRDLSRCPDVAALTPALYGLCSHFGRVDKLAILTARHEGAQQALCFLRMESPEKEQILMKTLGVGRFGGEVVFVVDLNPPAFSEEFSPSSHWSNFDDAESHSDLPATPNFERVPLSHMANRPDSRPERSDSLPGL